LSIGGQTPGVGYDLCASRPMTNPSTDQLVNDCHRHVMVDTVPAISKIGTIRGDQDSQQLLRSFATIRSWISRRLQRRSIAHTPF